MITQDLDQITNVTSRETILNHYAKETNSKLNELETLSSTFAVIGRTNSSSGVSCEFNDDTSEFNDDIYESIYDDDTYLQTSEHNESQISTTPAFEETSVTQSANEPVTQSAPEPRTEPVTEPVIQSTEETTKDAIAEIVEETPGQSEIRSQTAEDDSETKVNSIISRIVQDAIFHINIIYFDQHPELPLRWTKSSGSFTRKASTRPQTGRRPLFRDSTRTRLVSQEMNEILLQRSETQDSVIEDPESSNTKTNDNHESRTCVQCSFIPDNDNQFGFEKIVPTGIQNSREPSI